MKPWTLAPSIRPWIFAPLIFLQVVLPAHAANEAEKLALETQIQQRIEGILSKTLPPDSYLVTVNVEMESRARPATARARSNSGSNPFLNQKRFMLPGVPAKKEFIEAPNAVNNEPAADSGSEPSIRRISIKVLLAPDISAEQIKAIRDVVTASIPFNPLRGDDIAVENSSLLKPAGAPTTPSAPEPGSAVSSHPAGPVRTSWWAGLSDRASAPILFLLGAFSLLLIILIAFLFGPVRAFLNRLLTVLPRVGEQAAYAVSNSSQKNGTGPGQNGNVSMNGHGSFNGTASSVESDAPFHFIREEQLNKLPILFQQMAPPQVAIVLAYLPPEWASRVLGDLSPADQSAVMGELGQAREVPPEIVKDIEAQVKGKLPYLVGGVDWIQSVYQYTQPQTQKALLGTLNQHSPELALALRRKTLFFEDLVALNVGALRILFQEIGYPLAAMSLKDEAPEFRANITNKLPPAMREILQQELEMSGADKAGSIDAKVRLLALARRLVQDGRITLPEKK